MTLHVKTCITDAKAACDTSAMEKTLADVAAASPINKCTACEVGMGCQKMANDRPTMTRAELDSALEGV